MDSLNEKLLYGRLLNSNQGEHARNATNANANAESMRWIKRGKVLKKHQGQARRC